MTAQHWSASDWINRGAEQARHDPVLSQRLISRGLCEEPRIAEGWFNLGLALHQRRRINAAIRAYLHALQQPHAPVASIETNLSQDLLLAGDFQNGWRFYEQRLNDKSKHDHHYFEGMAGAIWQGPSDPRPCEHLVLVAEQGFGDTLQFLRMALQLRDRGLEITLFCQPALVPLLQESCTGLRVCSEVPKNWFTASTRWCPLMSLPHRLNLNASNIPHSQGYLQAEPKRRAQWRRHLPKAEGMRRIALHWQGNTKHEGKLYSMGRSMPFETLAPLATLHNVEFVVVQKGEARHQVTAAAGFRLAQGQALLDNSMDFRDTAAVLADCDLLISADSGVVHLAGALGVPSWVALRWIPEWRWGLNGSQTPWYKCLRLFRQPNQGNWRAVVKTMVHELQSKPWP